MNINDLQIGEAQENPRVIQQNESIYDENQSIGFAIQQSPTTQFNQFEQVSAQEHISDGQPKKDDDPTLEVQQGNVDQQSIYNVIVVMDDQEQPHNIYQIVGDQELADNLYDTRNFFPQFKGLLIQFHEELSLQLFDPQSSKKQSTFDFYSQPQYHIQMSTLLQGKVFQRSWQLKKSTHRTVLGAKMWLRQLKREIVNKYGPMRNRL